MEKPSYKLVGAPCGQHGQYTFYKAIRLTIGEKEKIVAIGDFFFVRIWQDSELVSVGELQLLWTDRVSDQTLVSLRLYFLPENTPDGRNQHGTDEVLAINDKVVVRAEDLLSWVCDGTGWRWGLRAVWRGACAPPQEPRHTQPLHHTKLDFSDVEREKSALVDNDSPGVVVFSYPRYCRYRALLSRLEGIQGDWLRDSLVAALGGYAAPTTNTRILYCKDTFEYPELEGHEFVCNELAPKLKGRPRGRRRRASPDASDRSESDHDRENVRTPTPQTPRRLSLRNGGEKHSEDEEDTRRDKAEEKTFLTQLRQFHRDRGDSCPLEDLSLRSLYRDVKSRGGYEAVCRQRLWRSLSAEQPARARRHYERYLLPYEKHENRRSRLNGRVEPRTVETIELDDDHKPPTPPATATSNEMNPTEDPKEELNLISKPAEELNREFLESLPKEEKQEKPLKISVKPVEKLIEPGVKKLFEEETKVKEAPDEKPEVLNHKDTIVKPDSSISTEGSEVSSSLSSLSSLSDKYVNGHENQKSSRPAGRSSLRAVRVKPARPSTVPPTSAPSIVRSESGPTINNFGIHRPPPLTSAADDDIVEVPYKPKSPEIIDLDEYPESPQSAKKKRLDILKERGLEVTAVPAWPLPNPQLAPLMNRTPMLINPAMQHQIMTQAQLFQMYNILPTNYNGIQPPKVIQATSIFGNSGPEKTVYGNPKDPFMPPPHVLHGAPLKPTRTVQSSTPPQDILDLTCKTGGQTPAVEIVRVPTAPSPSKTSQNPKNYTLLEGKAVVGSNLEITLVNPKAQTPSKNRAPPKRSSNGKFVSSKTPTPPKEPPRPFPSPSGVKKNPIVVPNYQINSRDNVSPTSSTGSRDSVSLGPGPLTPSLGVGVGMGVGVGKALEPGYLHALYGGVVPQFDPRHLAAYRDVLADQLRGYSGLLMGAATGTPTTKN